MFGVLIALLIFVLGSFGGVLPHSGLLLVVAGTLAGGVLFTASVVGQRSLSSPLLVCAGSGLILSAVIPVPLAINLFVGAWAYLAAIRSGPDRTLRFVNALLLIGTLEALLGVTQYFLSPGWIFGYENPSYRVSGSLINKNHFAGLLNMIIPASCGLAYLHIVGSRSVERAYVYLLAGAFMGFAVILSSSRMGTLSFLATILFLSVLIKVRHAHRGVVYGLALALVGLVVVGALWAGIDSVVERYAGLVDEDGLIAEVRIGVFRDTARMIVENPWGIGPGNYRDVFRRYQTERLDLLFDHAHNDYLETAAEWGLPLAILFWAFIAAVEIGAVRAFMTSRLPERRSVLLVAGGAIFSILVHSLTDFNLQIPSNAMLFFSFVGIALAMIQKARREEWRSREAGVGQDFVA